MTNLRTNLIKIAHANPGEVQDAILPLLAKQAGRMDFHQQFQNIQQDAWNRTQKEYEKLLHRLNKELQKRSFVLDMQKSHLDSYSHGSDGDRMDGMLYFADTADTHRSVEAVRSMLQSFSIYRKPSGGFGSWKVSLEES